MGRKVVESCLNRILSMKSIYIATQKQKKYAYAKTLDLIETSGFSRGTRPDQD